jgi:hypothetical protein
MSFLPVRVFREMGIGGHRLAAPHIRAGLGGQDRNSFSFFQDGDNFNAIIAS